MCEGDGCDCSKILTVCFCFKLCADCCPNTSQGGLSNDEDENKPLTVNNDDAPDNKEMSRFKF